eukprot:360921-Chlamydomonas_euryale.AAC.6
MDPASSTRHAVASAILAAQGGASLAGRCVCRLPRLVGLAVMRLHAHDRAHRVESDARSPVGSAVAMVGDHAAQYQDQCNMPDYLISVLKGSMTHKNAAECFEAAIEEHIVQLTFQAPRFIEFRGWTALCTSAGIHRSAAVQLRTSTADDRPASCKLQADTVRTAQTQLHGVLRMANATPTLHPCRSALHRQNVARPATCSNTQRGRWCKLAMGIGQYSLRRKGRNKTGFRI